MYIGHLSQAELTVNPHRVGSLQFGADLLVVPRVNGLKE